MKSAITKKYSRLYKIFFALSILVTLVPIIVYTIKGFVDGEITEKVTLGITLIIAIMLTAVNILFKYNIRSTLWIIVLGIYFAVESIMPLLLTVAISTIVDEFVLTPLYKSFKNKAKINKEIDKRI